MLPQKLFVSGSIELVIVKKKTFGYKERNEEQRSVYLEKIAQKQRESLVYLDESGLDDNESYDYGWGPKGPRIYGMKNAERKKRLSIISALNQNNLIAPFVFEGSCDRMLFEVYLEKVLIPELSPGQTIILDNASFHKGGNIVAMIKKVGCDVLYLPSYSPDFNPIEHYWSAIKHRIRQRLPSCDRDLYKAAELVFSELST